MYVRRRPQTPLLCVFFSKKEALDEVIPSKRRVEEKVCVLCSCLYNQREEEGEKNITCDLVFESTKRKNVSNGLEKRRQKRQA